jgi:O-antigen/teichoic acid export membrane protein
MMIFSKRYYLSLILNFCSIVVGVLMNQWLIPIMGIDGAAIATGCVWLASGIVMAILIWMVYKMQPITAHVIYSIVLFSLAFVVNYLWTVDVANLFWMSVLKSILLVGAALGVILYFRLSEDVYSMAKKMLAPLGIRLKD